MCLYKGSMKQTRAVGTETQHPSSLIWNQLLFSLTSQREAFCGLMILLVQLDPECCDVKLNLQVRPCDGLVTHPGEPAFALSHLG